MKKKIKISIVIITLILLWVWIYLFNKSNGLKYHIIKDKQVYRVQPPIDCWHDINGGWCDTRYILIEWANYKTFREVWSYAKDNFHIYNYSRVFEWADAWTFVSVWDINWTHIYKDKDKVYYWWITNWVMKSFDWLDPHEVYIDEKEVTDWNLTFFWTRNRSSWKIEWKKLK